MFVARSTPVTWGPAGSDWSGMIPVFGVAEVSKKLVDWLKIGVVTYAPFQYDPNELAAF
jgi:hypothetical protein